MPFHMDMKGRHFFCLLSAWWLILASLFFAPALRAAGECDPRTSARTLYTKHIDAETLNAHVAQLINKHIKNKKPPAVSAFLLDAPGEAGKAILDRSSVLVVGNRDAPAHLYKTTLTVDANRYFGIAEDTRISITTGDDYVHIVIPNRLLIGAPEDLRWKTIREAPSSFTPYDLKTLVDHGGIEYVLRSWHTYIGKMEYSLLSGTQKLNFLLHPRGSWDLKTSFLAFVVTPLIFWITNMVHQGALRDPVMCGQLISNAMAIAYFTWNAVFTQMKRLPSAAINSFIARGEVPFGKVMFGALKEGVKQNYLWSLRGMGFIGASSLIFNTPLSSPVFMISAFIAVWVSLVNIPLIVVKERLIPVITRFVNRGFKVTGLGRLQLAENLLDYIPQISMDIATQFWFPFIISYMYIRGLVIPDAAIVQRAFDAVGMHMPLETLHTGFALLGGALLAQSIYSIARRR